MRRLLGCDIPCIMYRRRLLGKAGRNLCVNCASQTYLAVASQNLSKPYLQHAIDTGILYGDPASQQYMAMMQQHC